MPKPPRKPFLLPRAILGGRRPAVPVAAKRLPPRLRRVLLPPPPRGIVPAAAVTPVIRKGPRPVSLGIGPAGRTQRLAAPALVRPVLPPVTRLRNVLRPVAAPIAVTNAPVQRMVSSHPFADARTTQRDSGEMLVPPILPPPPPEMQALVSERMQSVAAVRAAEAVAAQALLAELMANMGADPSYFLTAPSSDVAVRMGPILKGVHYGSAHGRGRAYGAPTSGPDTVNSRFVGSGKYKVTYTGKVWEYAVGNPPTKIMVIKDPEDTSFSRAFGLNTYYTFDELKDPNKAYLLDVVWHGDDKGQAIAEADKRYAAYLGTKPSSSTASPSSTTSSASSSSVAPTSTTKVPYATGVDFPTIKMGSTDASSNGAVSWVAASLGLVPVLGPYPNFDSALESKVKAFQTANNLKADGVVGTKTYAALGYTKPSSSSSSKSSSSSSSSRSSSSYTPGAAVSKAPDDKKTPLTAKPWFWPVAILVPTTLAVGAILLIPGKKA